MKHFVPWLVAALCSSACSSGSNHERGPTSSAGNDTGAGTAGTGTPGAGNSSQGGGVSSNGGASSNGGSGSPSGGTVSGNGGTVSSTGGVVSVGYALDCKAPATGSPVLRLFTRYEFENTINDLFPGIKGQWSNSLPANAVSGAGFDNDASNKPGNQFVAALTETAESVANSLVGTGFATLLPCSTTGDHACADTFVTKFGPRLFRRPLTPAEHDRYLAFFDSSKAVSDFKTAIKWTTVGLVQSPNAVFRSEIGAVANGARQLSPYEVATELAYTYTASTPDEALLAKAATGNLGDLAALAKAMLATEPGKRVVQRFFEGYLDYPRAAAISKTNITAAPSYASLSQAMVEETRHFVDDVVLQKGGGLKQLLTANTSNPSKDLATYYGFPAPATDFAVVTRPAGRGIGVLAQGAFLASHANSDASSPTQRGLFPYLRLLCQPKLSVPPTVPALSAAAMTNTTRQRYETAHAVGGCASCHKRFDPIGFGFEHFDEGGRYRDMQGGEAIDSAASVPGPDLNPIFSFKTQEELVTGLAGLQVSYQCFSAYMATYAFGTAESCLGQSKAAAMQAGTIGIVDALAALASEPHFTQRKAQ